MKDEDIKEVYQCLKDIGQMAHKGPLKWYEIKQACVRAGKGKAPGPDGMTAEEIKSRPRSEEA